MILPQRLQGPAPPLGAAAGGAPPQPAEARAMKIFARATAFVEELKVFRNADLNAFMPTMYEFGYLVRPPSHMHASHTCILSMPIMYESSFLVRPLSICVRPMHGPSAVVDAYVRVCLCTSLAARVSHACTPCMPCQPRPLRTFRSLCRCALCPLHSCIHTVLSGTLSLWPYACSHPALSLRCSMPPPHAYGGCQLRTTDRIHSALQRVPADSDGRLRLHG